MKSQMRQTTYLKMNIDQELKTQGKAKQESVVQELYKFSIDRSKHLSCNLALCSSKVCVWKWLHVYLLKFSSCPSEYLFCEGGMFVLCLFFFPSSCCFKGPLWQIPLRHCWKNRGPSGAPAGVVESTHKTKTWNFTLLLFSPRLLYHIVPIKSSSAGSNFLHQLSSHWPWAMAWIQDLSLSNNRVQLIELWNTSITCSIIISTN